MILFCLEGSSVRRDHLAELFWQNKRRGQINKISSTPTITTTPSSIIYNDAWTWPFLSVREPPFQPKPHLHDSIVQSISLSSKYRAMSAWNALRAHLIVIGLLGISLFGFLSLFQGIVLFFRWPLEVNAGQMTNLQIAESLQMQNAFFVLKMMKHFATLFTCPFSKSVCSSISNLCFRG